MISTLTDGVHLFLASTFTNVRLSTARPQSNLLPEIPSLPLSLECQQLLDTTLPKPESCSYQTTDKTQDLLNTIVSVSELLYSKRTPKTILQLHNVTWYHQTRNHLFGIYSHNLVAHAPQQVCLSQEHRQNT